MANRAMHSRPQKILQAAAHTPLRALPPAAIAPPPGPKPRRGAGVVERGGLENRCGGDSTQGSNPCLSATSLHTQSLPRAFASGFCRALPLWACETLPLCG